MKILKPNGENSMRWIAQSAVSAAILLLALGVAMGVVGTFDSARSWELVSSHGGQGVAAAAVIAVTTVGWFLTVWWLGRRGEPIAPLPFLATVLVGTVVVHLFMVATVVPDWAADYRQYWRYAGRMVQEGEYAGVKGPYYARALFFPYPVVKILGPDAMLALKLVNVALFAAIQLIVYDVARRIRSHQAAQSASLLFAAAPLPVMTILIPSHDLWGLFFLSTSTWLFCVSCGTGRASAKPNWKILVPAAVAGAVVYLTQVQRGYGLIFCLCTAATCCLILMSRRLTGQYPKRQGVRLVVATGLVLVGYALSSAADRQLQLQPAPRPVLEGMKFAANASGLGNGRSDWFGRFRPRFSEGYGTPEAARDLAISNGLSSWALSPLERSLRVATHAQRLYSLTYTRDWDYVFRKPRDLSTGQREAVLFYADVFGIAFGVLFLAALLRLFLRSCSIQPLLLTLLIFLVALSLPLLLFFENKPYNIFPIWMIGAITIGCLFAPGAPGPRPGAAGATCINLRAAVGGAALIAVAGVAVHLASLGLYREADGRILSGWKVSLNGRPVDSRLEQNILDARPRAFDVPALKRAGIRELYQRTAAEDGDRIRRYGGFLVTTLQHPNPVRAGDELLLTTQVCTERGSRRSTLEFFAYAPVSREGSVPAALDVVIDGQPSNPAGVPFAGKDFRRWTVESGALSDGTCHEIGFRLVALGTDASGGTPAFVEIWMPRLIEARDAG